MRAQEVGEGLRHEDEEDIEGKGRRGKENLSLLRPHPLMPSLLKPSFTSQAFMGL